MSALHWLAGYNLMSHWGLSWLKVLCVHLFFVHRVKLKEGVTFLGARPSNPTQWIVSQDVRSEGHRVVTLRCRRKESSYDLQRSGQFTSHWMITRNTRFSVFARPFVRLSKFWVTSYGLRRDCEENNEPARALLKAPANLHWVVLK